ncbi:hypothetical protein V5O48_004900 [Marasmius crinis-equi]|uniref:Uncharacterized protein n=1 Tax=Marasmius crinis-equi TaxID=585013 RepID=A0ABR3FNS7_9AGAR
MPLGYILWTLAFWSSRGRAFDIWVAPTVTIGNEVVASWKHEKHLSLVDELYLVHKGSSTHTQVILHSEDLGKSSGTVHVTVSEPGTYNLEGVGSSKTSGETTFVAVLNKKGAPLRLRTFLFSKSLMINPNTDMLQEFNLNLSIPNI